MADLTRRQFHRQAFASMIAVAAMPKSAHASEDDSVLVYDQPETSTWKMGFRLSTPSAFTQGIATFPVPMDWPEQTIEVTQRELNAGDGQVNVRELDGGAKQIVVSMPRVLAGTDMEVWFEMAIDKRRIVAPTDTSTLMIPKTIPRDVRRYMGTSPNIDTTNIQIRMLSKELAAEAPEAAWDRVRQIYDEVRSRVRYVEGPIRNASDALRTAQGDCEDMTSLFVALCRNARIPARMVWIPGHCYPEFYLEQPGPTPRESVGAWFPCQVAGSDQFGGMEESRPILQKGDRFKVPESRAPMRYVAEHFTCLPQGSQPPRIEFFREQIATD